MVKTRMRLVVLMATVVTMGCAPRDLVGDGPSIALVGFAVPQAANEALERAWTSTDAGRGVVFESSYGASGDQSRAVESGKHADYVHFSLESDVTRLVNAGLVDPSWNTGPNRGMVSDSVVVFVVRKGNPKHIETWDDLVQPGIGIVTPNPGSSGSARWNILSAWAHAVEGGGDVEAGKAYLRAFFANAVTLAGSGREATTAFEGGAGDVLISYENEAIFARQSGKDFDYVVPETTILVENPAAVLKGASPKAAEFLDYALSDAGQAIFAARGFRPIGDAPTPVVDGANDPANPFPTPQHLVTIADLGGWSEVSKKFFGTKDKDGSDGIITMVQNESGKGTS